MDDSSNKTSELTAKVALNPLMDVLYSDLFPDVLQNYNSEQTKELLSLLVDCPNNIINKKGPLGGYTALHWMAIKNDLENMEFLVTKCKAEIDCPANLGETPLLICIKYIKIVFKFNFFLIFVYSIYKGTTIFIQWIL